MSVKVLKKKICMIGAPAVGKTSLINRFVSNVFGDEYLSTVGTKITSTTIKIPPPKGYKPKGLFAKPPKLFNFTFTIWDIAGQKSFYKIKDTYYRGAKGAFVVCDLTRKTTFDELPKMVSGLYKITGVIPIILIGNKDDLVGRFQVTPADLAKLAGNYKAPSFTSSAKTGKNVGVAFRKLAEMLILTDR